MRVLTLTKTLKQMVAMDNSTTTNSYNLATSGLDITALFLGWQDPSSDLWLPVAKMTWAEDLSQYCLRYTKGMEQAIAINPIEKSTFIHHPNRLYQSHITEGESLKFKSRMPLSRTSHVPRHQRWFGLAEEHPIDPIAYVARSGGYRHQDTYNVFPEIRLDADNCYHFYFLPLDPWEIQPDVYQRLLEYKSGHPLQIDSNKVRDGETLIGKLPGHLAEIANSCPNAISINVAKVNPKSPHYYSLLVHARVDGRMYTPFTSVAYQTFQ